MRIIYAKHDGDNRQYAFEVQPEQEIKKGDVLLVQTRYGEKIAVAATNIIHGSGARDIAERDGARFPLKKVITYANKEMIECIRQKVKAEIITKLLEEDNLPYA